MARSEADALFDAAGPSEADALFDAAPVANRDEQASKVEAPRERGFLDYLKAKWNGTANPESTDVGSIPGVRTVETPTGVTHLDAEGRPVLTPDEAKTMTDASAARFKERVLEGGLSTLSGGGTMMDELAGMSAIGDPRSHRKGESVGDTYRRVRDETRRDVFSATRNASPNVDIAGLQVPVLPMLGAAIPSLLAPNPATALGRMGASTAVGATQSAGASDADLLDGDVGGFLRDTGRGAGVGLVSSGVVEGGSAPLRAISRGAGSRIGDAVATRAARDVGDVAGDVASLKGQLGGESQKMSRLFENTQRAAGGGLPPAGQSPINPSLQSRAMLALSDPSTARLQEKVIDRALTELPTQAATVTNLEQQFAAKAAGAGAEATKRTSDYFAQPVFQTEVAPRLGRLAYNAGTGALTGAATGGALGMGSFLTGVGDPVTAAGVGLATGLTHGLGKSAITMSRNALASPLAQVGALGALSSAAQGAASGMQTGARVVASTAGQGAKAAQENAFEALAKRFGINAKSKEELASEAFVRGQSQP